MIFMNIAKANYYFDKRTHAPHVTTISIDGVRGPYCFNHHHGKKEKQFISA